MIDNRDVAMLLIFYNLPNSTKYFIANFISINFWKKKKNHRNHIFWRVYVIYSKFNGSLVVSDSSCEFNSPYAIHLKPKLFIGRIDFSLVVAPIRHSWTFDTFDRGWTNSFAWLVWWARHEKKKKRMRKSQSIKSVGPKES